MARVVTEQACPNGRLIYVTGTEAEVLATLGAGTGLSNAKYTWMMDCSRLVLTGHTAVGSCAVCYYTPVL